MSQFTHRQHILLRIVQLLMRLRTLRQQQLEDRTEQDNLNHVESAAVDDVVSTHPVPFAWRQYSILDRHITSLVAPSLLSASRLSFIDPSVPVSLDSLQARLYGSSQLVSSTVPTLSTSLSPCSWFTHTNRVVSVIAALDLSSTRHRQQRRTVPSARTRRLSLRVGMSVRSPRQPACVCFEQRTADGVGYGCRACTATEAAGQAGVC